MTLRGTCSIAGSWGKITCMGDKRCCLWLFYFLFSVIMKLLIPLFFVLLFYCQSAGFLCPLDVSHVRSHLKGSVMLTVNNTALWLLLLLLFFEKEDKLTWPVIIFLVIFLILSSKMCHFDTCSPFLWKNLISHKFCFKVFLMKKAKNNHATISGRWWQ